MTVKEIEKTRQLLSGIDSVNGLRKIQEFVSDVAAFFGDDFNIRLKVSTFNTEEFYTKEFESNDKIAIRSFLESLIAKDDNASIVMDILNLIDEGEQSKCSKKSMEKFISKAYYSYSGKISFDSVTETIAISSQEALNFSMLEASSDMIDGIIAKLKSYAADIARTRHSDIAPVHNKQEINFQPQINVEAKNETNITIETVFENARQKIEDEGLSDAQTQELLAKLSELEEISNSKESKGRRWARAKEIMKWVVEQGIAAAGIIIPVLSEVIK